MMTQQDELWLDGIPQHLRQNARDAFNDGDALGFLWGAPRFEWIHLVFNNVDELKRRAIYEEALLRAYVSVAVNHHTFPKMVIESLFRLADRRRLRAAGEPLPGPEPFQIYRGVAGIGAARRVRGMSWTASFEKAHWFATRFRAPDPAVFYTLVEEKDVLAYVNYRKEQEFIVRLPNGSRPQRIWPLSPKCRAWFLVQVRRSHAGVDALTR